MPKPHNIVSFVLRFTQELWNDPQGEPHIRWRGHIRHVQGNEEERFTDFAEAVTFMQRYLNALTKETLADAKNMTQEKVFAESFKIWNQFAISYAKVMTQAMQQSMKRSEAFREQMDEAGKKVIDALQFPYQSDREDLLKAIDQLNAQVTSLSEQVESLEKQLQDSNHQ